MVMMLLVYVVAMCCGDGVACARSGGSCDNGACGVRSNGVL